MPETLAVMHAPAHIAVPMLPHALGEAIDVPSINFFLSRVQLGTEVTAPPGAMAVTPRSPSVLKEDKAVSHIMHTLESGKVPTMTLRIENWNDPVHSMVRGLIAYGLTLHIYNLEVFL